MNKKDYDTVDIDENFLSDISLEKLKTTTKTSEKRDISIKSIGETSETIRINKTTETSTIKINSPEELPEFLREEPIDPIMEDIKALEYEAEGIAEDNAYKNGNDDFDSPIDIDFEKLDEEVISEGEMQNILADELENKIKSQSAEKTIYAPSTESFMDSIYEEADKASEDFVNDLISKMPTSEEYSKQEHVYETEDEYSERRDTINHVERTSNITFFGALTSMFTNMFNFKGYASVREFWFSILWIFIFSVIANLTSLIGVSGVMVTLVTVVFAIPYISLITRRFHDVGIDNWVTLAGVFQGLSAIIVCLPGFFEFLLILTGSKDMLIYDTKFMMIQGFAELIIFITTAIFGSLKPNRLHGKNFVGLAYAMISIVFLIAVIFNNVITLIPVFV